MTPRRAAGTLLASLAALGATPALAGDENPWPERRVLHIAHQGGEWELPSNTMYAFKRAVRKGAEMLELDVHATADGRLAVIHDATVDRTTEGSGLVSEMRFKRLKRLDAAHDFVPGSNAVEGLEPSAYPLRGVRTGKRPPPGRYRRRDFRVPTLGEVFRRFPKTPINIEIKGDADSDLASFERNAEILARFLNRRPERAGEVIVVSFNDAALTRFRELAPGFSIAPGLGSVAAYFAGSVPPPAGTVAIQIPVQFEGVRVATADFVARAHADGYAVHVFPDHDEESDALYSELLGICVDGIMTAYPRRFERYLREHDVVRPGSPGTDPCAG